MGEKIRIKDIEGDSDALKTLFESLDCSLADYLNVPRRSKKDNWILPISAIFYIVFLCVLWNIPATNDAIIFRNCLAIISFTFAGCVIIYSYLCWKNIVATIICALFVIFLYKMAIGSTTPEEAANDMKGAIEEMK